MLNLVSVSGYVSFLIADIIILSLGQEGSTLCPGFRAQSIMAGKLWQEPKAAAHIVSSFRKRMMIAGDFLFSAQDSSPPTFMLVFSLN